MKFSELAILAPIVALIYCIGLVVFNMIHAVLLLISAGLGAPFWIAGHFFHFAGLEPVSSILLMLLIIRVVLTVREYLYK
ncbi:hypothetical protein QU481_09445 [Crenobacter sp. SG2303]|uniref:Uncharacterized protein n=1 Tax=Crenobacter oryzisoli TaxID=3056844 RepID=A0ABT7XN57_9NEIS|nr:hypothetical protein [Crenobacter sp. SG2303]MDN0075113.1 hypothetical protein [Crenobacter sp. SG2303]